MREGDWMSLGELQREQMTDEDKEIALWVSDKMPQLVKDLTRICRIPSVAVVSEDKKPPYGPECVRVLDEMLQIGKEYGLDTKNFDSCVGRIRYGDGEKSIGIWSQPDLPTPRAAIDAIRNINRTVLEYSPSQGYLSYREKLVGYYAKYRRPCCSLFCPV